MLPPVQIQTVECSLINHAVKRGERRSLFLKKSTFTRQTDEKQLQKQANVHQQLSDIFHPF